MSVRRELDAVMRDITGLTQQLQAQIDGERDEFEALSIAELRELRQGAATLTWRRIREIDRAMAKQERRPLLRIVTGSEGAGS